MNVPDFLAWCRLRGLRTPKNATAALGLPEAQLPAADSSIHRVSIRVELACIGYEYCYEQNLPGSEMSIHYTLVQQRIRRFIELEPGPNDEELATALVLGLASLVGLEKGEQAKQALLRRTNDLISRSPDWSEIANGSRPTVLNPAGGEYQWQMKERKTASQTLRFSANQTRNNINLPK